MHKKGQILGGVGVFVIIFLAIVAAVVVVGWFGLGGIEGLFAQEQVRQKDPSDVLQTSDTTPTYTFKCFDEYDKSTVVSCDLMSFKVNGELRGSDADAAIEVDCGDSIEGIINASNYYKKKISVASVPCTENPSQEVFLKNYDTSPDLQIYCQDDGLLNSITNTEGLAANAVDTQTVKVYSSYRDCVQGGAFFVSYVSTNIDKMTSSLGSSDQKPKFLGYNTTDSNVQDQMYIFQLGDMCNNDIKEFTFTIDVAGTAFNKDNMTVGIIDKDWYVDSDGRYKYDYEDEDNNDLGQTGNAFRELFYTATS